MLENDLTNIEMLIMKCIWDTPEELALSQLVAMVNERFEKSWKPQTISTYLAHLVRKGYLSMRRKGKVFLYHPEVSEEVTDPLRSMNWLITGEIRVHRQSSCPHYL